MKPRILLIGKNGQVGSELSQVLRSTFGDLQLTALGRQELDLSQPDAIRHAIQEAQPSVIINAAAYTAVDLAEKEQALAHAINARAPEVMADQAKKIGALLVHYSTDYVFDGTKRIPYSEDDRTNPLSAYGHTKLAGEEAIRAAGAPHLIFRTAWVYATSGKNFLLTILRLASEREELRIVNDQFGAPTWSHEIAVATARVIGIGFPSSPAEPRAASPELSGTYHLTAAGQTTWYEFATATLDECSRLPADTPWLAAATRGRPLIAKRVIQINTEDYPTPALRPSYSVLSNQRFTGAFGFSLPDWRNQLRQAVAR
jgi:dTDP-4-dehydrorhamnose reductase